MKPISINDIVRENSGYICCRSQICERVKLSDGACKGKGGESGPTCFEDFPSAISLGGDDAESGKPFDLLGTQDGSTDWMGGVGTSADGDMGCWRMSTERSSWESNGVVL
ncbi:hypothetical protein U1Q18_042689 [Sarracenia purpurea var. burkii]